MNITSKNFDQISKNLGIVPFDFPNEDESQNENFGLKLRNGKTIYLFSQDEKKVKFEYSYNLTSELVRKGEKYQNEITEYFVSKIKKS